MVVNPFDYSTSQTHFNITELQSNDHRRHYAIKFPIAFPGLYHESNIAQGEYFEVETTQKLPLVILIHGWGDHSALPLQVMARNLSKRGMHCFLLYLPFHSRRLPGEMKKRSPNFTPEEWFDGYRIAVTDIRQILDWAETREEIDTNRVALIGLSLGSFVSSITMGVDDRIKTGVFIVSGGNSAKIQQHSRFAKFRKQYRFEPEDYEDYQNSYMKYLKEVAEKGWENVEPDRPSFQIDPLTYAYKLKDRSILMINAWWDEFIPRETTIDFHKACGECKLIWFPTTHPSIWLFYPSIVGYIYRFLRSSFEKVSEPSTL